MNKNKEFPSQALLQAELKRERNRIRFRRIIKNTINTLIIVAAIAVLITTLVLPVLQISGTSMEPSLKSGDIVVLLKGSKLERGDLCSFSYSNKLLIKRVIGLPGDSVYIDADGSVYINGGLLEEPYISEKALGECDLEFPYTVPENTYFLMGDQRASSIDSRSTIIGCIPYEQIIGRLFLKVWPIKDLSLLK